MWMHPTTRCALKYVRSRIPRNNSSTTRLYTTVIMRNVPSSMAKALSMSCPLEPINIKNAEIQHDNYIDIMKKIVVKGETIILKADDNHPDCVFIEDTAVVIDDRAVICRIGAESRIDEVDATKEALLDLGLPVHDMRHDTEFGTCDGGDVLYPVRYDISDARAPMKVGGNYLFVGISSRTNYEGAEYLQHVFPNVEVVPIKMRETNGEALHLKSIVTHIDHKTLVMPDGSEWDYICDLMDSKGRGFEIVRLPDISACNVVSANNYVVAQSNICKQSKEILEKEVEEGRGMKMLYVDASEFSKCDGALTCKNILIP